jgi:hypothetical protein
MIACDAFARPKMTFFSGQALRASRVLRILRAAKNKQALKLLLAACVSALEHCLQVL